MQMVSVRLMLSGELESCKSLWLAQETIFLNTHCTIHYIRLDDGFFRMYYTGEGPNGETAIGVAKSLDLKTWEREQAALGFVFE